MGTQTTNRKEHDVIEVPTLVFVKLRDTKRFALYVQEGNDMNKVYLQQGLPERIIYVPKAA